MSGQLMIVIIGETASVSVLSLKLDDHPEREASICTSMQVARLDECLKDLILEPGDLRSQEFTELKLDRIEATSLHKWGLLPHNLMDEALGIDRAATYQEKRLSWTDFQELKAESPHLFEAISQVPLDQQTQLIESLNKTLERRPAAAYSTFITQSSIRFAEKHDKTILITQLFKNMTREELDDWALNKHLLESTGHEANCIAIAVCIDDGTIKAIRRFCLLNRFAK
ncbi:MAG TPA: hypothetical protein V6C97_09965 [Oculatellaceae cyanobacterium]